jgi:hypothetical protein
VSIEESWDDRTAGRVRRILDKDKPEIQPWKNHSNKERIRSLLEQSKKKTRRFHLPSPINSQGSLSAADHKLFDAHFLALPILKTGIATCVKLKSTLSLGAQGHTRYLPWG